MLLLFSFLICLSAVALCEGGCRLCSEKRRFISKICAKDGAVRLILLAARWVAAATEGGSSVERVDILPVYEKIGG